MLLRDVILADPYAVWMDVSDLAKTKSCFFNQLDFGVRIRGHAEHMRYDCELWKKTHIYFGLFDLEMETRECHEGNR